MLAPVVHNYLDKHHLAYRLIPNCQLQYFNCVRAHVRLVSIGKPMLYLSASEIPDQGIIEGVAYHSLSPRVGQLLFPDAPKGSLPCFGEPYHIRTLIDDSLDHCPELALPTAHPEYFLVVPSAEWLYITRTSSYIRVRQQHVVTRKAS